MCGSCTAQQKARDSKVRKNEARKSAIRFRAIQISKIRDSTIRVRAIPGQRYTEPRSAGQRNTNQHDTAHKYGPASTEYWHTDQRNQNAPKNEHSAWKHTLLRQCVPVRRQGALELQFLCSRFGVYLFRKHSFTRLKGVLLN